MISCLIGACGLFRMGARHVRLAITFAITCECGSLATVACGHPLGAMSSRSSPNTRAAIPVREESAVANFVLYVSF